MSDPHAGQRARLPSQRALSLWVAPLATLLLAVAPAQLPAEAPTLHVKVRARSLQPGEVARLDITSADAVRTVSVTAFGRSLSAFPAGDGLWRCLVGLDLDVAPGDHPVHVAALGPDGAKASVDETLTVTAKEFPTRTLRVNPKFVTPPSSALARIKREQKRLGEIFATVTTPPFWDGAFIVPISGTVVSGFGVRSVFNHQPRAPHSGADFASPTGTPIHAPNAGAVVLAEPLYYTGNTIVVDHGAGLVSLFAHLSKMMVTSGDHVTRGQVLGEVGATGRVTGPHLHWTVRLGGARVDPLSMIYALQDLGR